MYRKIEIKFLIKYSYHSNKFAEIIYNLWFTRIAWKRYYRFIIIHGIPIFVDSIDSINEIKNSTNMYAIYLCMLTVEENPWINVSMKIHLSSKPQKLVLFDFLFVWWCLMPLSTLIISVILWQSVLLLVETGEPEKTIDMSQVTDRLYHIMFCTSPWLRFKLTTLLVIGTDCIGSCKSNYHTITVMTAP